MFHLRQAVPRDVLSPTATARAIVLFSHLPPYLHLVEARGRESFAKYAIRRLMEVC